MGPLKFDAFSAGVEPGGLRTKNEIRILVCYLLSSVDAPLAKKDLIEIAVENGLANYFEITDAIADLTEKGIISISGKARENCSATGTARMISKQLDSDLPATVRHKALCAATNLLARAKREQENRVEIKRARNGFVVACHISGGDADLMNFSLCVPTLEQANIVKNNFQDAPGIVYRTLLALVTGNQDVAAGILRKKNGGMQ